MLEILIEELHNLSYLKATFAMNAGRSTGRSKCSCLRSSLL